MSKNILIRITASLLILLFTYTGLAKLAEHSKFLASLQQTPFFGTASTLVSWLVPAAELLVAISLVFPHTRVTGFYAAAAFMWSFTFYLGYMLLFVKDLPCSCGGVIASLSWKQHLVFNIFFLLLAIGAILLSKTQSAKKGQPV